MSIKSSKGNSFGTFSHFESFKYDEIYCSPSSCIHYAGKMCFAKKSYYYGQKCSSTSASYCECYEPKITKK
ncbi:MAG: hypothetical protein K2L10_06880 [Ruminococcus sp.]|nr:hypothetical protein [Ruminococcus sp.]